MNEIAKKNNVSLSEFSLRATGAFSVPTQEIRKESFFSGLRTYCKNNHGFAVTVKEFSLHGSQLFFSAKYLPSNMVRTLHRNVKNILHRNYMIGPIHEPIFEVQIATRFPEKGKETAIDLTKKISGMKLFIDGLSIEVYSGPNERFVPMEQIMFLLSREEAPA